MWEQKKTVVSDEEEQEKGSLAAYEKEFGFISSVNIEDSAGIG